MAAFPPRERAAFDAHWAKVLVNPAGQVRTILFEGQVAGNVLCYEMEGQTEIGYWLGQVYWGRGIATQALALFLKEIQTRPLYAHVVQHNLGSRRVLEKCGFALVGEDRSPFSEEPVAEWVFRLD